MGHEVMTATTRLDKVVEIRERTEERALVGLARARVVVETARERLARATQATQRDTRRSGPVELWQLDELAHRRALQALRVAEGQMQQAARGEANARDGYVSARQDKEIVQRVRERRRAELALEAERRERRAADEIAMLKFNAR